ncbi:MAG TPA: NAD-dependent epimerase/dehydratase family protein [Dehalococcoidia bacterium]|nr:NAD-dependent epimerase/dehydratase family protein [Dehalococcoidia bacterium]
MKRNVLVTGGAGFIGSHVVEHLLAAGDAVQVVDDLSKGQIANLPDGAPVHVIDIASSSIGHLLRRTTFDAVVHCAAQTNVMRSLAEPDLDRRINIEGLRHVLDAAVNARVPRFVFISSGGAVYGETPIPASESTPPRPDNPYGRHKLEGEAIVASAPISSVSLRLSNVYGRRQRSDAEGGVISIFTDRIAAGLPLQVYGDGEQVRDFVDVGDVVAAIALALDDAAMDGVWNVGTGVPTSVNTLVRYLRDAFPGSPLVEYLPARPEVRRSCLDVTKLSGTGRWSPRVSLDAGVRALAASAMPARRT